MTAFRLLSLGVLLLFGCHDAPVPLGPAEDATTMESLEGHWEPVPGQTSDELVSLRITPFNEHEYYLEYWSQDKVAQFPEILRMRGYITRVGDVPFANIQFIEDEDDDYLIVQFEMSDDQILGMRFVNESMDHIETSEALYDFVRTLWDSGAMEEEEVAYFRKVEVQE